MELLRVAGLIQILQFGILVSNVDGITEYGHYTTRENSIYSFHNGTVRFCLPIFHPGSCPAGNEIKPCYTNNEEDRCVPCLPGHYNLDPTTSDYPFGCYPISCPENMMYTEEKVTNGCNMPCTCNASIGYVDTTTCSCRHVDFTCGPNTFLLHGICTGCPAGYEKPGEGYGPCQPITTKEPEASSDLATSRKQDATPPSTTDAPSTNTSTDLNEPVMQTSEESDGATQTGLTTHLAGVAVGVVGVVLLVLVIISTALVVMVVKWKPKRGQKNKNDLKHDPEQNQGLISCDSPSSSNTQIENCSNESLFIRGHPTDFSSRMLTRGPSLDMDASAQTLVLSSELQTQPQMNPEAAPGSSITFNVGLIYKEGAEADVEPITNFLKGSRLQNGAKVKAIEYRDPSLGGSLVNTPDKLARQCRLVLVVLTNHIADDEISNYVKEEVIATRFHGESEPGFVRPLHTQPQHLRRYRIPEGLKSVRGVDWFAPHHGDELLQLLESL